MLHVVALSSFMSFCNRSQEIQKEDDFTEDTDPIEEPLTTAAKKKKKTKVKDATEPQPCKMSSARKMQVFFIMACCNLQLSKCL